MDLQNELHHAARRCRRRIILLTVPTFVALAVEVIGGWRFQKDMYSARYAIHIGALYPLLWLTLAFIIVGPLMIAEGLRTVFLNRNTLRVQKGWFPALLFGLTISLLLSMFSCAWSCGGHPTWTAGYQ